MAVAASQSIQEVALAPRRYQLGKRAENAAETHRRILEAASSVFRERGVAATSIAEVARAADVSRGTVLNHFGSSDGLFSAVLDDVVRELDLPDGRILEGSTGHPDRVSRFVDALCRFYERSAPWWQTFGRGFEDHPVYKEKEASFWTAVQGLAKEALGPRLEDRRTALTVWTILHPWPYGQLRWTGMSVEESIATLVDLVLHVVPDDEEVRPAY